MCDASAKGFEGGPRKSPFLAAAVILLSWDLGLARRDSRRENASVMPQTRLNTECRVFHHGFAVPVPLAHFASRVEHMAGKTAGLTRFKKFPKTMFPAFRRNMTSVFWAGILFFCAWIVTQPSLVRYQRGFGYRDNDTVFPHGRTACVKVQQLKGHILPST